MQKFRKIRPGQSVIFNTCRYEEDLELGKRHYKPQHFEGTLRGMQCLSLECTCGDPSNHEAITGPVKSKASATYPTALCQAYAKLAIGHLKLMGKEEFLRSRMASLQDTIDVTKARIIKREDEFGPGAERNEGATGSNRGRSRPRSRKVLRFLSLNPPTRREYKAATADERPRSPARLPLKRRRKQEDSPTVSRRRMPGEPRKFIGRDTSSCAWPQPNGELGPARKRPKSRRTNGQTTPYLRIQPTREGR